MILSTITLLLKKAGLEKKRKRPNLELTDHMWQIKHGKWRRHMGE